MLFATVNVFIYYKTVMKSILCTVIVHMCLYLLRNICLVVSVKEWRVSRSGKSVRDDKAVDKVQPNAAVQPSSPGVYDNVHAGNTYMGWYMYISVHVYSVYQ